ncbi:MAG: OadG family protein [Clostridia bacterium]|nr:OadG family protein [Clostridia bacterium]
MNFYELSIDQTTPGEIIANGVVITIEGMLVVFLILILIMLAINVMGLFLGNKNTKKVKEASPVVPVTEEPVEEATEDEGELIAVLTAAIAACMGTSSSSVNIRSYKKVSSAWGNAAKREILDNRF